MVAWWAPSSIRRRLISLSSSKWSRLSHTLATVSMKTVEWCRNDSLYTRCSRSPNLQHRDTCNCCLNSIFIIIPIYILEMKRIHIGLHDIFRYYSVICIYSLFIFQYICTCMYLWTFLCLRKGIVITNMIRFIILFI